MQTSLAPRGTAATRHKSTNHRWTEEERDYIRNNYRGTHASREAIAEALGISPFAVAGGQIAKMGIAKCSDRRPPGRPPVALSRLTSGFTIQQLCAILARITQRVESIAKLRRQLTNTRRQCQDSPSKLAGPDSRQLSQTGRTPRETATARRH